MAEPTNRSFPRFPSAGASGSVKEAPVAKGPSVILQRTQSSRFFPVAAAHPPSSEAKPVRIKELKTGRGNLESLQRAASQITNVSQALNSFPTSPNSSPKTESVQTHAPINSLQVLKICQMDQM